MGALSAVSTYTLTCSNAAGVTAFRTVTINITYPSDYIPAWAKPLHTNQWVELTGTMMSALDPCPSRDQVLCPYIGNGGQAAIMGSWGGGAYDTKRDRLIIWGGGHADYGGNEIYTFDIVNMSWTMEIPPTMTTPGDRAGTGGNTGTHYHDGTPSSRHTASALVYAGGGVDRFFSMSAGAVFGDPSHTGYDVDSFNFDTKTWKTDWVGSAGGYDGAQAPVAAYHPGSGHIWYHAGGSSPLMEFDATFGATGKWTTYAESQLSIEASALIDTKRNRFVVLGGAYFGNLNSQLLVFNLASPNTAPERPASYGNSNGLALESRQGVGFIYDPIGDRYLAWDGGATVYVLNPDTWEWTILPLYSANMATPSGAEATGTYGRFAYVPRLHGVIVVSRTTENVFFLKL